MADCMADSQTQAGQISCFSFYQPDYPSPARAGSPPPGLSATFSPSVPDGTPTVEWPLSLPQPPGRRQPLCWTTISGVVAIRCHWPPGLASALQAVSTACAVLCLECLEPARQSLVVLRVTAKRPTKRGWSAQREQLFGSSSRFTPSYSFELTENEPSWHRGPKFQMYNGRDISKGGG